MIDEMQLSKVYQELIEIKRDQIHELEREIEQLRATRVLVLAHATRKAKEVLPDEIQAEQYIQ